MKIPHIGLVNVVAGREVAPEFVQDAFVPARVADALDPLLRSGERGAQRALEAVWPRCAPGSATPGASERVAAMAAAAACA